MKQSKIIAMVGIFMLFVGLMLGAGITQYILDPNPVNPKAVALGINSGHKRGYWIMATQYKVYLYDSARYIGGCNYGKDGIDSILIKDLE
jgi:hypothetical protein